METKLEYVLTHSHKDEMISFMNAHPEYFEEAVELAISNKQPYSWRAAWLLWSCITCNDLRVQKYIQKILDSFVTKTDGHQRELIKILLEMELNNEQQGCLFDICVSIWEQVDKKPSVRFTAFRYINKMSIQHPDLKNEIAVLTEERYLNTLSPTARKSINEMIRKKAHNKR